MDEKKQFDINPEYTVDSTINGEAVLDNPEDTEKKETPTVPIEEGKQQVSNGSNGEQSTESKAPVSEPAKAPTLPKQDDVTAGEMKAEIERGDQDGICEFRTHGLNGLTDRLRVYGVWRQPRRYCGKDGGGRGFAHHQTCARAWD